MCDFFDARRAVQLLALVLAAAATAFLLGSPAGGGTTGAGPATLVDVDGRWVIWLLLVPVLVVAIHALWPGRSRTVAIVACTVLLFLFSVAGMLTVGRFFMPAVLASGLALLVPARTRTVPRPG